ncbi:MAG: LysR family transcriptional regulator [Actinomycetota bacterium]|nr:MAG: LysR family transcriptional regulator [Actinomycetota bacterium]
MATPTVPQLRAFVAVADLRHFGDAAALLGVSQPALSQALSALEHSLGIQLVERTTRRVLVTADGVRLLDPARAVLDAVDRFRIAADADRGLFAGPLRIGVIPTVAPYLLPAALRSLGRQLPAVTPQIHEEQTGRILTALRSGTLDVGILALPTGEPGLAEVPLYDEDFLLVVPAGHRWAGVTDLPHSALGEARLLLLDEGHCLRDQALEVCAQAGAHSPEAGSTRAASLATVVQLVAADLGTTLLPESAVAVELRRGALATARFADPAPGRRIGLVHRGSSARTADYERLAAVLRSAVRTARVPVRPVVAEPATG